MTARPRIEPAEVVAMVEEYVESELRDEEAYSNRKPLDGPGVYSLHLLAAQVYAKAWEDAERAVDERQRRSGRRDGAALRRVEAIAYASDDGTEYEHNGHGPTEGEPECPACWAATIRRALRGES